MHAGHICAGTGLAPCHAYTRTGLIPAHTCTGTGLTPPTSAPRLGPPRPPTSAPGLGSPVPHLHRDWAHRCHICIRTKLRIPSSDARLPRAFVRTRPCMARMAYRVGPDLQRQGMRSAGGPWAEAACAASVRAQGEEAVPHRRTSFFLDCSPWGLSIHSCPGPCSGASYPLPLSVLPLFRNRRTLATEAAGRSVAAALRAHAERATMRWPGGVRSSGGRAVMVFDRFRSNVWLTPCRICTGIGPNPCFI